jgi:hypothetical protein
VGRPETSGVVSVNISNKERLSCSMKARCSHRSNPGRSCDVDRRRCVSSSLTSGTAENSRNGVGLIGTSMNLTSVFAGRRNIYLLPT